MKKLLVATMIASAISLSALTQTPTTSPVPSPAQPDTSAPLPGANSFTEAQAKSRLESNGYTQIGTLQKDGNGVWMGSATHANAKVSVSVDYRGNIVRK